MKKTLKLTASLILTLTLLSSIVFASAVSARSSLYLNSYSASISAGRNGKISISARIIGHGKLSEIGVSRITVYESSDGKKFTQYGTYDSDGNSSMMGTGAFYDQKAFEFTGTIGNTYKATVYCYGSDGSGSDSKPYYTNSVVAKR